MENEIRICLLRHGKTPGNIRRGYIGSRTDENLDNAGRQELMEYKKKGFELLNKVIEDTQLAAVKNFLTCSVKVEKPPVPANTKGPEST